MAEVEYLALFQTVHIPAKTMKGKKPNIEFLSFTCVGLPMNTRSSRF